LSDDLFITGVCSITLLKGSCQINGFNLVHGQRQQIVVTSWMPALSLLAKHKKTGRKKITSLLKKYNIEHDFNPDGVDTLFDEQGTVVLVEEVICGADDWLLAAEDSATRVRYLVHLNSVGTSERRGVLAHVSSAVVGCYSDLIDVSVDCQTIPESWTIAVDDGILVDTPPGADPRIVICGARGS
jgi:hypothetical protein